MKQDLMQLLGATAKELETILSSKTVVGAPIELNGSTVVPLISVGFAMAVGGGSGAQPKRGQGDGTGLGCGGGIRPVAVIISNQDGVRVEAIKGGAASAAEKIAETVARAASSRRSEASEE